jgi:pimeloyl-ACP methyl ester carboxylesterase
VTGAAPLISAMGEPKYVTVGGRQVRYLECGKGDPILLVHGWIGSAENFHKWVPELSARRRMIMPDLPGFGESAPLEGSHSIAALATALEAFASALGLRLFDLGGLCLGATVALELARRDPERVRQLVLHTPIYARPALRTSFKAQIAIFHQPVVFPVVWKVGTTRWIADLYRRVLVGEGTDVDQPEQDLNFANQVRCSSRAAREWLVDALNQDFAEWLKDWEQPVLMIVAGDDNMVDVGAMQGLCESMQTAEVVVVPGAGHGWNDALIQAQAAAITGFLSPQPI